MTFFGMLVAKRINYVNKHKKGKIPKQIKGLEVFAKNVPSPNLCRVKTKTEWFNVCHRGRFSIWLTVAGNRIDCAVFTYYISRLV